jgi:hypothetical protein
MVGKQLYGLPIIYRITALGRKALPTHTTSELNKRYFMKISVLSFIATLPMVFYIVSLRKWSLAAAFACIPIYILLDKIIHPQFIPLWFIEYLPFLSFIFLIEPTIRFFAKRKGQ